MEKLPKDILFLLALDLDLIDIVNFCKSHKEINRNVCKNISFWRNKIEKDKYKSETIIEAIKNDSYSKYLEIYFKLLIKDYLSYDDVIFYLRIAAYVGSLEFFKLLAEKKDIDLHQNEEEYLRTASKKGHMGIIRFLVEEKGANVNAYYSDAVKEAAFNNHLEVVKYLFSKGAKLSKSVKKELLYNLEHMPSYYLDVMNFIKMKF